LKLAALTQEELPMPLTIGTWTGTNPWITPVLIVAGTSALTLVILTWPDLSALALAGLIALRLAMGIGTWRVLLSVLGHGRGAYRQAIL